MARLKAQAVSITVVDNGYLLQVQIKNLATQQLDTRMSVVRDTRELLEVLEATLVDTGAKFTDPDYDAAKELEAAQADAAA